MSTLFQSVELAPRDPILGLNEQFNADPRSTKVNLGVGVYYDDNGKIPLLAAVHKAEVARVEAAAARGYLPIEGIAGYNKGAQELVLGKNSSLIADGRVLTMQALGGTGALKIGADFIKQLVPNAKVAISDPSWENHRALFERAGFDVVNYPYYDAATHGLNFKGMLDALRNLRTILGTSTRGLVINDNNYPGSSGRAFGVSDNNEFILVSLAQPVPEPEAYALMLAGLGLVGWGARRRMTR